MFMSAFADIAAQCITTRCGCQSPEHRTACSPRKEPIGCTKEDSSIHHKGLAVGPIGLGREERSVFRASR